MCHAQAAAEAVVCQAQVAEHCHWHGSRQDSMSPACLNVWSMAVGDRHMAHTAVSLLSRM
jgi:hypothetical protein